MWTASGYSLRGIAAEHHVELTPGRNGSVHLRLTLAPEYGQWQACLATLHPDRAGDPVEHAHAGTNHGGGFISRDLRDDEKTLLAAVIADIDVTLGWKTLSEAAAVIHADRQLEASQQAFDRAAALRDAATQELAAAQDNRREIYLNVRSETLASPVLDLVRALDDTSST